MERLTKRISKTIQDKYSLGSYLCYDFAKADDINKLLNKLGEFEDFMEEMGFEDLEHLKLRLKNLSFGAKYYTMWQKLKEFVYEYTSLAKDCQSDSQASRMAQANNIYRKMQKLEKGE